MIRLQKYLAQCGIGSRRAIEKLIQDGRITVNGNPVPLGIKINPETDKIYIDNKPVSSPISEKVYILLNKPKGVVTTASDELGRPTVMDLVKKLKTRVFPVGRLDLDVEGALLLTNDGELANSLLHPSNKVPKTYIAVVKGFITIQAIKKLQNGVQLDDGKTAPAKVKILLQSLSHSHIQLTIHEGKKREIKRMCSAVGFPVISLKRISFAGISLQNLPTGQWRYLTPEEIAILKNISQKYQQAQNGKC
ncbi:MAG: rRNA pseudouridine synthase [Candidatus Hydrogenedens sp.]|nr:rRNA pseudouridine synthase [Candidatus Hydrogenedens sp.]